MVFLKRLELMLYMVVFSAGLNIPHNTTTNTITSYVLTIIGYGLAVYMFTKKDG